MIVQRPSKLIRPPSVIDFLTCAEGQMMETVLLSG